MPNAAILTQELSPLIPDLLHALGRDMVAWQRRW